jgi:hypothetical protein
VWGILQISSKSIQITVTVDYRLFGKIQKSTFAGISTNCRLSFWISTNCRLSFWTSANCQLIYGTARNCRLWENSRKSTPRLGYRPSTYRNGRATVGCAAGQMGNKSQSSVLETTCARASNHAACVKKIKNNNHKHTSKKTHATFPHRHNEHVSGDRIPQWRRFDLYTFGPSDHRIAGTRL